MKDTKTIAAAPTSTSEGSVGGMVTYIDPVKEAKMMQKFDGRSSVIFAFSALASAFGGLFAYGLTQIESGSYFRSWRALFIIEGALTILICPAFYFLFPESPTTARFLTPGEKEMMRLRYEQDPHWGIDDEFSWHAVIAALVDPKFYAHFIFQFAVDISLYGFTTFLPAIIKGLGFTSVQANLLTVPVYFWGLLTFMFTAYMSDRLRNRGFWIGGPLLCLIVGYAILISVESIQVRYFACFVVVMGIYPTTGMSIMWLSDNVARHFKRATMVGATLTLGNTAGVAVGQIFTTQDSPRYITGLSIAMGLAAVALGAVAALMIGMHIVNKKREAQLADAETNATQLPHMPELGDNDVYFSYIERIRAENDELRKGNTAALGTEAQPMSDDTGASEIPETTDDVNRDEDRATADAAKPLLEDRISIRNDNISLRPVYVGGAACTAFATRLGCHLRGDHHTFSRSVIPVLKHADFQRSIQVRHKLPRRAYARLLVQTVVGFVGQDYHLLRKRSYFTKVDQIYDDPARADSVSLCRLFAVLALGELYLKGSESGEGGSKAVPGTAFFLQAVMHFEEHYEEPDVEYIETLLLLNNAYTYTGLALRLSISIGLHRNITYEPGISLAEIENRRRVWWTVYTLDRVCSAKLGHPMMIRDEDIDAPLPSSNGLTAEELSDFMDAAQLLANIKLSRITGSIMSLIYGSGVARAKSFIANVHKILNSLKQWDLELPSNLKLDHDKFPTYGSRSVASLRLHFNQCIILTTRPVLLHVLNYHIKPIPAQTTSQPNKPLSVMTIALSEACIYAARASANLLAQLWADGRIAKFGYFDAHYAFSSTVMLLISNTLRANDSDADAIGVSLELLQSMVEDGNLPAQEMYERLVVLRKDIETLKTSAPQFSGPRRGYVTPAGTFAANIIRNSSTHMSPGGEGHGVMTLPSEADARSHTLQTTAPLNDPFIQDFLSSSDDQTWSPDVFHIFDGEDGAWSVAWDNTDNFADLGPAFRTA
ncbi:C6 transcription factor [Seiridium cupressi]